MLISLASRIFSVLFCGQLAAVAPGFWQIFKEADCLKFEDESTNTFFLFWATAVDPKKKKTFLCSTIPHVCRMLSRKVDKVSKDVERTRDPRGLQVGETPPDDSGVPQAQSSLGIHVTGEV